MPVQAATAIALKKIDGYLSSIPLGDVLTGKVAAANDALTERRSNIAHAKLRAARKGSSTPEHALAAPETTEGT
jgi:hypothetical protein